MIETRKLSNGAAVLFERVTTTGTVSVGFWYPHGSRDEGREEHGYSHFLEHMLFKGTEKRSAYKIAQEIDRVGGLINAFTEKEATCFYCTIPKDSMETAVDVLTDMIVGSKFDEHELNKEMLVVLNEIHSIEDSPDEKAHELYMKLLWNSHPLSRKITGEESDIRDISREKLLHYYKKKYHPSNLVISIAGNIDIDRVYLLLENRIGILRQEKYNIKRVVPKNYTFAEQVKSKFSQVHVYTGTVYKPSPLLDEYYDMVVFSTLFGESISSRLFQVLREGKGLCYTVYSFRTYFSDVAIWTIYVSTTPSDLEKLLQSLKEEIKKVTDDAPSKEEINDAKTHLIGSITIAREDMETRMKRLARQYILRGRIFGFKESMDQINNVNKKRVDDLVKKIMVENHFNLLVYGKGKTKIIRENKYFL